MGANQQLLLAKGSTVSFTYATWNPADKGANLTLSGSNLIATTSGLGIVRSTIGKSTGKWYWEITIGGNPGGVGTAVSTVSLAAALGNSGSSYDGFSYNGAYGNTLTGSYSQYPFGATFVAGDVIGMAFDIDAGTLSFYKNGILQGTGQAGFPAGTYYAAVGGGASGEIYTANFGASTFSYSPPSGFNSGLYT